jgi:hypothetical protein
MVVIVTLLFSVSSFAALGKIAGKVTDEETGEPLAGAQLQIVGTSMGAAANADGEYFILNIPPGTYVVKVSFMGYATKQVENVRAQLDVSTTLDIQLKATVIEGETVSVVAERPIIDKKMTATRITFSEEAIQNTMPVTSLNEVLQSSVTVQAMRGANKSGVGYLIDGVKVTDIMWASGGGSMGYSNVKHDDTPTSSSTGAFENGASMPANGRQAGMVQTVGQVQQSMIEEANVIVGTINAEYSSSGGVVNLASKSGGKQLTAKLFVRSSLGGLSHSGPDVYDGVPPDESYFGGKSASQHYLDYRESLLNDPEPAIQQKAALLDWTADKYEYGEKPRMNGELYIGGPLTSKGNFFFTGSILNDNGRFPGEFQRLVTTSLKVNYDLTPTNKLTAMAKIDDGGKLLGWKNRQFSYMYLFFLEGQPVNEKLGIMSYLKWNKVFNPSSFLETTLSYVANNRTYGYCPVSDKLQYDNYGDFVILDTKEKSDKYIVNTDTRIFNVNPGNDQNYQVQDFGNQIRFGLPGYLYEDFKTSALTLKSDFTKQMDFHHQLKAGFEYVYNTIDNYQHASSVTGFDPNFPFETVIFDVNPWSFGSYVQDRIEYEGVIVNVGLRFDGYNLGSQLPENLFDPVVIDTMSNGQAVMSAGLGEDAETHLYFSPRLGISHPITENAAMHYSWGIYTTPPTYGYWLFNYGVFSNPSLPQYRNSDPEPERATAYEIGVNVAITNEFGADLTAYYRDTRNASAAGYTVNVAPGSGFSSMTYITSWGYRDSRGIELQLWKRPSPEKYFGVVGVSGNLSIAYAYDKASASGISLVTDKSGNNTLYAGTQHESYNWDERFTWPSYSRGYNNINAKMTLMLDFPMDIKLASISTYRSPWRYAQKVDVVNERYENMLDGESFFQTDIRLMKYVKLGNYRAGFFVEVLNVLDKENILRSDTWNNWNGYEEDTGPWGQLYRPVDQYGNPIAGLAREIYAGFEFSF